MPARRPSRNPTPVRDSAAPPLAPATPAESQAEVVRFLSDPRSYPSGASVQVISTHASVIFLVGDRAYKLKRAVRYSYLDYSTIELRRLACDAELSLNRRTAPELYLSILPVRRTSAGTLSLDGSGEPVDWLVAMRRFPQEALLSHLADQGKLTPKLASDLAGRIAAFHAAAAVESGHGGGPGIAAVIGINDENLRRAPPLGVTREDIDRLHDASHAALEMHAALLDERRAAGRVRRCHGDLHLANICLIDGQPTLFDCIEFSDLIACIDVLYDLAFLLMDLDHRALKHSCSQVFNRYIDLTHDDGGIPAIPLFLSLRAAVRAHVVAAAAQAADDPTARRDRLAEARAYFDLAVALLQPRSPRLVAIGGLSGTGKSTIAAAIAGELGAAPGARILRSDVMRKQLFGKAPEDRLPEQAYSQAVGARVYAALEARAAALLAAGHSVIIDAVSARPEERAALARLARNAGAAFDGFWLEASPETLLRRIASRGRDASDATAGVLRRQLTYELGTIDWVRVDVDRPRAAIVEDVRRSLQG